MLTEYQSSLFFLGRESLCGSIPFENALFLRILADICGIDFNHEEFQDSSSADAVEACLQLMFDLLYGLSTKLSSLRLLDGTITAISVLNRIIYLMEMAENSPVVDLSTIRDIRMASSEKLSIFCDKMLSISWHDECGGAKKRYTMKDVGLFVELSIFRSPDHLLRISTMSEQIIEKYIELLEADENGSLQAYPTVNINSLQLFLVPVFVSLTECLNRQIVVFDEKSGPVLKGVRSLLDSFDSEEWISTIDQIVSILLRLIISSCSSYLEWFVFISGGCFLSSSQYQQM
jgi:hypothetical protein